MGETFKVLESVRHLGSRSTAPWLGLTVGPRSASNARMAAKKKKQPVKQQSGGALMGMRSGFQKITGTGGKAKSSRSPWTFQQVLMAVAGVALVLALVYTLSR